MRVTDTGGAGATMPATGTGAAPAGRTRTSRPCLKSSISKTVCDIVNNFILLTKYPFLYCMFYGCSINPVLHVRPIRILIVFHVTMQIFYSIFIELLFKNIILSPYIILLNKIDVKSTKPCVNLSIEGNHWDVC